MEQEHFSAEEPEKKLAKRKRRGLDVRGFLEEIGFLEQRNIENSNEENDENEKTGKKKRRKKIGEWLREKKEKFFGPLIPEPLYIRDETYEAQTDEPGAPLVDKRAEDNPLFAVAQEVSERQDMVPQPEDGLYDQGEKQAPDIQRVIDGLQERTEPTTSTEELSDSEHMDIETYEVHEDLHDLDSESGVDGTDVLGVRPYRVDEAVEPEIKKVDSKRAVAVSLLLAGAERHARRAADKAIEKKHDKDIKNITTELEHSKAESERLVRTIGERQNTPQSYEQRVAEQMVITPEHKEYPRPIIPEPYPQRVRTEAPKFAPPVPEFMASREQNRTITESVKSPPLPEASILRPETVLKQVEAAAEQNIPIEALYERRQEIKDDAAAKVATQQRAAIINAGGGAVMMGLPSDLRRSHSKLATLKLAGQQIAEDPLYKRAVVSGMSTALVIVAVLIIIMLVG